MNIEPNILPKIVEVHCVHGASEERSNGPITAYFSSASGAAEGASNKGWYGGNAPITIRYAIVVGDKYFLLDSKKPIDIDGVIKAKKDAEYNAVLSKLTPEEFKILKDGLSKK